MVLLLLTVTDTPKSAAVLQKFASLYIQLIVFTIELEKKCAGIVYRNIVSLAMATLVSDQCPLIYN